MSLSRHEILREVGASGEWDIVVIGGGATGLGTAVDAASRGYRTLLLEAQDFSKGTSSRSTKLVHGGVRYLKQGNLKLVLEALRERGRMLRNAPHLAHRMQFVVPAYEFWELPFYGAGLTVYDLLAGREGLGRSRLLSSSGTKRALPTLRQTGLKGAIVYWDGQFDDARFAIALLRTLFDLEGVAANYVAVTGLLKRDGRVRGVEARELETDSRFEVTAKVVINATGVFADAVRRMDEPQTPSILRISQGTHFVLPHSYFPGESALMIPRSADGRVLFAIPWHNRVVVGTTDDPVEEAKIEPRSLEHEREFLLKHLERFLGSVRRDDILSMWSGQRPLVRRTGVSTTAALSRDHTILISDANLITITGGKWTTYRRMAEDTINCAAPLGNLPRVGSRTRDLRLHGWSPISEPPYTWEHVYGADLPLLRELANEDVEFSELLHPRLPFRRAEVVWAVRYEMARCVEDVLARRTRALFLDARASIEAAGLTARLIARELGHSEEWQREQVTAYRKLAGQYVGITQMESEEKGG